MSNYQKKYYFQFTSSDGKVNLVELFQDTAIELTAEEVESMSMPFSVEMPDLDHKFQVVRGTGCEINLLSPTDRKFFDGLYHTQMKEFWIKHWIDDVLNWTGFLNSELVRESYSEAVNYPFQITGNDGFALLDRLQFLTTEGAKYTGIKSQFELIDIATTRMGLFLGDFYLSLSTRFTGQGTASDSSILHETYVDCANFYDEDGVAFTMRKVIEGCLAPYGAFIMQMGGNIWVTDVNTLAQGTAIFKRFECGTGNYFDASEIVLTKDLADIGYMGTGSEIEMSGGKNKQVISYSPYPFKNYIERSLVDANEFGGLGGWTDFQSYQVQTIATNNTWNDSVGAGIIFAASREGVNYNENYYIKIPEQGTYAILADLKVKKQLSIRANVYDGNLNVLQGVKLIMSGQILYEAAYNPYKPYTQLRTPIATNKTTLLIQCGSLYYVGGNTETSFPEAVWQSELGFYTLNSNKSDASPVNNEWINLGTRGNGLVIDFPDGISGEFNISFIRGTNNLYGPTWIKDIQFAFVDYSGKDVSDNDIEYIGYLDQTVKEEAEKIELICGTDATFIDRGKLMNLDGTLYKSITEWTRDLQSFKIEELLLNSLSSNYTMGYLTLSNLKLTNAFNQLNLITDTGLITAKNFMVKSKRVNFRDNLIEATIVEIQPDSLTIVPQ